MKRAPGIALGAARPRMARQLLGIGVCAQLCGCLTTTPGEAPARPATAPRAEQPDAVSTEGAASVPDSTGPAPFVLSQAEQAATQAASKHLVDTLRALSSPGRFALGHEDSTAYGVGWAELPDRSDVKLVCGAHPAVYGWDLFRIEIGKQQNGDGVNFDLMRQRIEQAHRLGGVNTISWHVDNPVSGGDAWDTTRAVEAIVPGGSHHARYRTYLDRVADFLLSCRGDQGELIPVVFRPFHEHTGSWFWWGRAHTNDEHYVALWRFTVDHLRNARGLGHLLFAFSPGGGDVASERDYLFRYPGDDVVDVMGVDMYYDQDVAGLMRSVRITVRVAEQRGKLAALTEFGVRDGLSEHTPPDWFSRNFFQPLVEDEVASRIAYALAWRNAGPDHFFLPHPGHRTAEDFRRVCDDGRLLLQRDLPLP